MSDLSAVERPTGRDRPCPRCGAAPATVYPRHPTAGYMSYCSTCRRPYGSAPPRPKREPNPVPAPRPLIASYTLEQVRSAPTEWEYAAADLTSTRYAHLRRLLIDEAGGRCTIRRPGCTGAATEVDHGVPRSVAAAVAVDLDTLRPCCQSCNHAEWRAYADLHGPPRDVVDLTASGLALLAWLDDNDVSRSFGRRKIDRLPGRPAATGSTIDDVSIWRRFNPPGTRYPPQRPRLSPSGRSAANANPRRPLDTVAHLVDALDRLAVPLDVGPGPARAALTDAKISAGAAYVDDAQRWRRVRAAS
ncbi:hypothetical protein [Rhodococcus sp. NPDC058514]|uniref:hypothetical protein n=1 Tax=unclassified Rhodococcus (in: high G+C Gram-positive bacteria) TaxID=192944 RepID=UPI00366233DE